jgi:hypothetical protein
MMAKKPKNRFQSAAEVCEYLKPYAVRKPIEFDFEAVLRERAQVAEKRLASESIVRGDSRTSTLSQLEVDPAPELKKPKADTSVREDTLFKPREG